MPPPLAVVLLAAFLPRSGLSAPVLAPQTPRPATSTELRARVAEADGLGLGDLERGRQWVEAARDTLARATEPPPDSAAARDWRAARDALAALLEPRGASAEHGWSVPRRVALLERWRRELAAEDSAGDTQTGAPLSGLLGIGRDPRSGLREYWHMASGQRPGRDAQGALVLEPESGIVLVALPGGAFRMGAQAQDPGAAGYDPLARPDETPHEVELSPFLISKFEVTQAQWRRLSGENPSYYGPDGRYERGWNPEGREPAGLEPVENVSWNEARAVLASVGLALPTEAQWEYAARGGTTTPWWTGAQRESLAGAANLLDRSTERAGADWPTLADWPGFDDGYAVHAPVGTFPPNPFGLHEVAGNVWEWCRDAYGPYAGLPREDPFRDGPARARRVFRGGSWHYPAPYARSACRGHRSPGRDAHGRSSNNGGLRPVLADPR